MSEVKAIPGIIIGNFALADVAAFQAWVDQNSADYMLDKPLLLRIGEESRIWCLGQSKRHTLRQTALAQEIQSEAQSRAAGGVLPFSQQQLGSAPGPRLHR